MRKPMTDRKKTMKVGAALWAFGLLLAMPWAGVAEVVQTTSDPLVEAAKAGDAESVRGLLAKGADVNAARGDGMTALHWAGERGDAEVAGLLIAAGADIMAETRIGGYTPLHLASGRGHVDVAQALIEAGADVRRPTRNNRTTPLHLAAASVAGGDLVTLLLANGADPNVRESSVGQTPLMFAAERGRDAAVRKLIEGGADIALTTEVVDVLDRVAQEQAASDAYRSRIAEFRTNEGGGSDWEPTPAQVEAAILAQREVFGVGKKVDEVLVDVSDEPGQEYRIRETLVGKTGGMTALLYASREGHIPAALALLEGGADVNQVTLGDQTSPLLIATLNGRFDLALTLLDRGADPNLAASADGATPLFAVIQTQWSAKSIYPQPRAHDLQQASYMDVMRALLDHGADPNVPLKSHLWYWEYGYTRIGIDIKGATPLWRAAFAQDLEAMRLLAAHGADAHIPTTLPEVGMRESRQLDGRAREDSGLPPVPAGAPNAYPIHAAAGGGYTGLGAWTVQGVPDGFMPAVKYLVEEHGADVNAMDWWGYRPLHYAASRGDTEMIRYLVDKGADVTALTRLGQSAADVTRGGQGGFFTRLAHPEAQALLEELGSPLVCLNVTFRGTGDTCETAGTTSFEDLYGFPRVPLEERGQDLDQR